MDHHPARKKFSQNFLQDPFAIGQIINAINPQADDIMIEIGPGPGALTEVLLEQVKHLTIIEKDPHYIAYWQNHSQKSRITLIDQDVLKVDFSALYKDLTPKGASSKLRLVGNLPYHISSPIIFAALAQKEYFADMHFLLQKEFVARMGAAVNESNYGRLSLMCQYHSKVSMLDVISADSFKPKPKVDSQIVSLVPHKEDHWGPHDPDHFAKLVQQAFSQRRKTLGKSLKDMLSPSQFKESGIDPKRRPQTLSVAEFLCLSRL